MSTANATEQKSLYRANFQEQDSLLDDLYEHSTLRKSIFSGIYHLLITFQYLYLFSSFILRIMHGKIHEDVETLIHIMKQFYIICTASLLMTYQPFLYSPTKTKIELGYFISCFGIYRATEVGFFAILVGLRENKKWPLSHFLFVGMQGMVMYMKSHSYFYSVLAYREAYYNKGKEKESENSFLNPSYKYPETVEFGKFFYFLIAPVLIFEPEYPRSKKFRLGYLIMKTLQTFFYLIAIYETYVLFMRPVMMDIGTKPLFFVFSRMILPFGIVILNGFLCVFEGILNGFAEISGFADRRFYLDFWNSTSFDEYSRKWNKIVHEFLKRHIYLYAIESFKLSNFKAYLTTLLYSAFFHEFLLYMLFGFVHPILTMAMLLQAPLIFLGSILRKNFYGNSLFWTSMVIGMSSSFFPYIIEKFDLSYENPFAAS